MCTVSFVPLNSSVLITSNRDESISRGLTLYPKEYKINNIKCTFPKDEKSLGTWIGYNEFNDVAVLLNGAFIKHESKTPYKKSRGLIITEMLSNPSSINDLEQQNFTDIEPFTLIVYSKEKLFEYKWDGKTFYNNQLPTNTCHLWNSATLYSNQIEQQNRAELNSIFTNCITQQEVYNFHHSKKYETQLQKDSLLNNINTISITQVVSNGKKTEMLYKDLTPVMEFIK